MSEQINLNKSKKERILNIILFELIAFIIVVPLFAWLFNKPMTTIGLVSIISTIIATTINFLFNLYFDNIINKLIKTNNKYNQFLNNNRYLTLLRTILFQIVILAVFTPLIMIILDFNFWQSLKYNLSGTLFFSIYFYLYNYIFDKISLKMKNNH